LDGGGNPTLVDLNEDQGDLVDAAGEGLTASSRCDKEPRYIQYITLTEFYELFQACHRGL
jgi:hypothetical protein